MSVGAAQMRPRRGGLRYSPVLPRRYSAVLSSRLDKSCVANEDKTKVKSCAAEEGWTQVYCSPVLSKMAGLGYIFGLSGRLGSRYTVVLRC